MNINNTEKIDPIPPIDDYPVIKDASKNGNLVIFIGAGVPKLFGCMLWEEMAKELITSCYTNNLIDYWQMNSLINDYGKYPRRLITIAETILSKNNLYHKCVNKCIKGKPKLVKQYPFFSYLSQINAIYVTTNIDGHFSEIIGKDNTIYELDDLKKENLTAGKLFHLHGSIKNYKTLVLTIDEYMLRYRNNNYKDFLDAIFQDPEKKYVVLFIGYSISEMEIIDFLFEKHAERKRDDKETRYYIMLPLYSHDVNLLEYERNYFSKVNMHVIPYAMNKIGYGQLFDIVKDWAERINSRPSGFYENIKVIDENI